MTTDQKIARRKLSLPELASELSNVSKACKLMGYSRQQFYEIRRNFRTYGADGLIDRLPGARRPHPNRVAPEIEAAILAHALEHPCHSRYGWARLYSSKLPVTAVHLMNTDVLPAFEAHNARIEVVLSGNGREYCGRPDQHPYALFLQLEAIEHRTTRVKRPQSNGIAERFHRTLLDEHFRVEGRRTWFETIGEMQAVLDDYLAGYNTKRPHQGRGMNGRTPETVFIAGLPKPQPKQKEKAEPRKRQDHIAA